MDCTFVDVQGFIGLGDKFIVKEVAFYENLSKTMSHYIFRDPYQWSLLPNELRHQVKYLQHNHHGFRWTDGFTNYGSLAHVMRGYLDRTPLVLVKGLEKISWLGEYVENLNAVDMLELGCPSLKVLRDTYSDRIVDCGFHAGVCAFENVQLMRLWYNERMESKKIVIT